ncbi:hypothetical protein NPIL_315711 [Nephila pilipes]|uniref:Uncharacterized protein n=1 Tax=Nephila pilipes TaxID=299642 RepID=A0A8X6TBC0_NEPPI|nr:hypothetical protein NPIL_315711 [Nephila pilipes]
MARNGTFSLAKSLPDKECSKNYKIRCAFYGDDDEVYSKEREKYQGEVITLKFKSEEYISRNGAIEKYHNLYNPHMPLKLLMAKQNILTS